MFQVAILGCENSHDNNFLTAIYKDKIVDDVQIVGVYGYDPADPNPAQKLHEEFGVYVAESYDEFVGKVDGVIITARHGDHHYKYAKPYLDSGIPMFIDKPITCSQADAVDFMAELKARNIPVSGGSVCVTAKHVQVLKKAVQEGTYGKVYGGFLRAPVDMQNPYGDFFFYCQHLVQVMMEIFGNYPRSVQVFQNGKTYTCVVRYADYDVTIVFQDKNYLYYAGISCEKGFVGDCYSDLPFDKEFMEFHDLLLGHPQQKSYEDFFAPVYVQNAIARSIQSGKEETITYFQK